MNQLNPTLSRNFKKKMLVNKLVPKFTLGLETAPVSDNI